MVSIYEDSHVVRWTDWESEHVFDFCVTSKADLAQSRVEFVRSFDGILCADDRSGADWIVSSEFIACVGFHKMSNRPVEETAGASSLGTIMAVLPAVPHWQRYAEKCSASCRCSGDIRRRLAGCGQSMPVIRTPNGMFQWAHCFGA
jgi:hypothetical protein